MIPIGEAGVATERRKLTLRVEHDNDCDGPLEWDGQWTLHSFSTRHSNYKDPEELGLSLEVRDGMPVIKNPGLRRKFERGLAFIVSCYQHGGIVWSIKGTGPQCRFDTAQIGGLLVWDNPPSDMGAKTPEDRRKDAESFLRTWNSWANGECYWYSIEDEDGETVDSCGGFIGSGDDLDYMWEAIRSAVGGDDLDFAGSDSTDARDLRDAYESAAKRAQSGKT